MHVIKQQVCFDPCMSRISHKSSSKIISGSQHWEEVIAPIDRRSMVFGCMNPGMKGVNTVVDPDIGIVRLAKIQLVLFVWRSHWRH